jgi:hypothetical protein
MRNGLPARHLVYGNGTSPIKAKLAKLNGGVDRRADRRPNT